MEDGATAAMTREDLIDVSVYSCVRENPSLTPRGIQYLWSGFTVAEVKASLERLAAMQLVTPTAAGATSRFDVQWSAVKAPVKAP